ncbi:MAG: LysM peptidoglycan-binding domain-containing protein, partial [Thermoguttaceae bacterium]|nr:LysM peptidoglycan-binding domain-containing protein [Thermoguttaceae bacterium]
KTFPRDDSWPSSRWGISMGIGVPGAGPGAARIHKIADGDTLAGLAERYLGDPSRAGEIYRANRDVLASPDALPIGRELKIPAAHDAITASP